MVRRKVRRGQIYYADLGQVEGSEQGGVRPVLVIQNNVGNRYSPTVIVAAITSQINKAKLPTHLELNKALCSLDRESMILFEQIRTIDKSRLKDYIGSIPADLNSKIDTALIISLGIKVNA